MSQTWYEWHVPKTVSPSWKKYRTHTTALYGLRTLVFTCIVILGLAVVQVVFNRWIKPCRSDCQGRQRYLLEWRLEHRRSLTIIFWTLSLAYFIFSDTYHDLVFLVKRLGRVSVALMPPIYFLTLKPSLVPGIFYLNLLLIHKWLSRIMIILVVCHALLYVYVYSQTGKLYKLLYLQNLAGIASLGLFITVAISSVARIRRRLYFVFYGIHYVSAWLTVILIWYHSNPPSTGYMSCCLCMLIGQIILRVSRTAHMKFPVQYVSSSLLLISIPRHTLPKRLQSFSPGSHIRISNSLWKPSTWVQASHPYTIASLRTDENFTLAIRKSRFPIKLRSTYSLYGPYKSLPTCFIQAANKGDIKRALFVVGGAGISYAAPVFRYLKSLGVQIKLIWAIRDTQDANILKPLLLHSAAMNRELEIYFTSRSYHSGGSSLEAQMDMKESFDLDNELDISIDEACCMDTPLNETSSLLSRKNKLYNSTLTMTDVMHTYASILYNGRPVLSLRLKSWLCGLSSDNGLCCCVDQLSTVLPRDKVGGWVIAAGNKHLVRDSQRWALTNGFSFHQEDYTL